MKTLAIACAAMILLAATASAGELAVSNSTLGSMGLGGMQLMSDEEGSAVRGKAVFAQVRGGSRAQFMTANSFSQSQNQFAAGAEWLGPVGASASGASLSFAGDVRVNFVADPTGFLLQVQAGAAISGGGATAMAM